MDNALNKKIISGVKLAPKAPIITHLLFADDCIIFSGIEEEEIYQLKQILNQYTSASRQVINLEKSRIIFGNQILLQTSLAKRAWRVIKNLEAIWVQVLKGLYFSDCDFWNAPNHQKGTWVWNSLLQGMELIKCKGKWSIGKGSGVKPLNRKSIDNQRVEELLTPSRDWNRAIIQRSFSPVIAEKIFQTPVSRISKEDRLWWPLGKDGEFTTKTRYYVAKIEEDERSHNNRPSSSLVLEDYGKEFGI
ncbi:hypothetical protein Ahy_A07g036194 [Arachis hypogaea]|uniref:Reverse transcriptase domain-containing protein n=1 Tax=Arachis hypogaea TaxID=3818 RepID=A0A445CFG9_ARAHY|nr:hypothetical protein Ahy_A07g036194 [Arachis hypogaea]